MHYFRFFLKTSPNRFLKLLRKPKEMPFFSEQATKNWGNFLLGMLTYGTFGILLFHICFSENIENTVLFSGNTLLSI